MDRDLLGRRQAIDRARANDGADADAGTVPEAIRASWQRCVHLLDTERDRAPVHLVDEIADRWDASPIRRAAPHVVEQLEATAHEAGLLALVTDPVGRVLWQSAPQHLVRRAEQVGLVPGGLWEEPAAGTNGIAMALVTGRPSAVFASEHWCTPIRDWVCYSAPVYQPDGSVAGVIDLSTAWDRANPLGLGTVGALARLIESALVGAASGQGGSVIGTGGLDIKALGRSRVVLDGRPIALGRRQLEIVTILALVGATTLDELHPLLFGDRPVNLTTLKAEISRARRALGGAIASRPYRLTVPVRLDVVEVLARLQRGAVTAAADLYDGQLLPASEAPLIVERRYHIDVAVRTALLAGGSTADLLRFAAVHTADLEVLQRAVAIAGPHDPQRASAVAALAVAMADLNV